MTTTEIDYSTKDIADRCGLSPRMVNIYRSEAETRLKRKLGYKVGKVWYFKQDEVREILKSREMTSNQADYSGNQPTSPNFQETNNAAEVSIIGGMDAIVSSGDQNAIAVGQALGMRWNGLMWTAALQSMQSGMAQMQQSFSELHASVTVGLNSADLPQLPGNTPNTPALPDHFVSDEE